MKQDKKCFSRVGFAFLAGTIAIYGVQWISAYLIQMLHPEWLSTINSSLIASMLPMYLIGMPMLIFLITRIKVVGSIETHKISFGKMILAFFMCYAIVYVSNLVGTMLTFVIGAVKGSPVQNVLLDIVTGADTRVLFLFTVICAPIYEEFVFRKLLVNRTIQYGEGVSILLSGLMFGLFHGNLSQFMYAFSLGLFFAFIYVKTGKVRYPIILHMAINFMGSILPMFFLKNIESDKLMNVLEQMQKGSSAGIDTLLPMLPALIALGVYALLLMVIVVTGVVLLIVYHKKFKVSSGMIAIPKGQLFSTVIVNKGMILFMAFWLIQMIRQLLS